MDLPAQRDFYSNALGLPATLTPAGLEVKAGATAILFMQAPQDLNGAYHFAFNIPENQIHAAKTWVSAKTDLLRDENRQDLFDFSNWNAHSFYFKDAAGNILEFIARHDLKNGVGEDFNADQILCVSEIGLPSDDVIAFADELCARLNVSVFKQEPNGFFTPVGDDNGLFILPARGRIWYPNTGVPAALLPVRVKGKVNGMEFEVRGMPYEIIR